MCAGVGSGGNFRKVPEGCGELRRVPVWFVALQPWQEQLCECFWTKLILGSSCIWVEGDDGSITESHKIMENHLCAKKASKIDQSKDTEGHSSNMPCSQALSRPGPDCVKPALHSNQVGGCRAPVPSFRQCCDPGSVRKTPKKDWDPKIGTSDMWTCHIFIIFLAQQNFRQWVSHSQVEGPIFGPGKSRNQTFLRRILGRRGSGGVPLGTGAKGQAPQQKLEADIFSKNVDLTWSTTNKQNTHISYIYIYIFVYRITLILQLDIKRNLKYWKGENSLFWFVIFRHPGLAPSWWWWFRPWPWKLQQCWRPWRRRWRKDVLWRSCWNETLGPYSKNDAFRMTSGTST